MNKIDYFGLIKVMLLDVFAFFLAFAEIDKFLKIILLLITIAYTLLKGINELIKFLNRNEKNNTDY